MRQWLLLLSSMFMVGCTHSGLDLKPNEKLSTQSYSVSITGDGWWTGQKPEERISKFQGTSDRLWFSRQIPNIMSEHVNISVSAIPQNEVAKIGMLYKDKSDGMEEYYQNFKMSNWEKKNNAERGVKYTKNYVDFIGGLKCATRVESSNLALGVGTKSYQTSCYYFDNQKAAKHIHLDYRYTYTHSGTKYEDDSQSSSVTPQAMERQFKQDMKEIFDSLVIHDMDKEKMAKEGLLHDKKYEIQEW
ncbi:MAG: hypothetical protein Q8M39_05725 [Sulfuricurvum sp.]|nr:hypothetical protein [Sulfuricurvum sp.]